MDETTLTDLIYEAALVPSQWRNVLNRVSGRIEGRGGYLFGVRDGYVSAISSESLGDIYEQFVAGGWALRDPRMSRGISLNYPGFVNDNDLMTDDEIVTNDVYANFFRPQGIGYMAGTIIPMPSGDSIAFVFQRHQDSGPVPRKIVSFLDLLRPHLARAALTTNRIGFERAMAKTEALQALGLPAAVLRGGGRVLAANGLFEALIPNLFQDRKQRLAVTDAAADALLGQALAMLHETGQGMNSIPVSATAERLPMVLHLVPVRRAAQDIFTQASALLVVTPIDRAAVPTAEVLQGLFDLTPAEARVARGIVATQTVDDLVQAMDVSRETVRSQLKAVLGKTGVNRQAELVALLAGKAIRTN